MTTLYKPVLIESAEQAEALPVGTVAYDPRVGAAVRVGYGLGWSVTGDPDSEQSRHMLGFTALVPIEAEEEHTTRWDEGDPVNDITRKRRLVTPWEEA